MKKTKQNKLTRLLELLQEELDCFEKALKFIEKGYGVDKCPGYAPGCANCTAQQLVGHLENHIQLLKWEIAEE